MVQLQPVAELVGEGVPLVVRAGREHPLVAIGVAVDDRQGPEVDDHTVEVAVQRPVLRRGRVGEVGREVGPPEQRLAERGGVDVEDAGVAAVQLLLHRDLLAARLRR